ncbi:hypothetical protein OG612_44035 (plasmid) [Streptomyces sp. NBC_01527]|uniref:hypothetical protein n=1 Tax=unclassified Streptomyces TaxID=2593676 RepID=UPI002E0F6B83|nr:hypothetical protein OG763_44185 [Streptomyces sp. NBC_01230]
MSNQSITVDVVNPETLPADRFTASDVARVALGNHTEDVASRAVSLARLLGDDLAVAGDYVNAAWHIQHTAGDLVTAAVVAERVRGASWEDIAKACVMTAAKAEEQWGQAVAEWQGKSPAQNLYLRETGRYAKTADRFIESGRPYSPRNTAPKLLSAVLDAASEQTNRDVAAADRKFAGGACSHCAS